MDTNVKFPQMHDAFPDFDQDSLPIIPSDWTDVSFHNDACPCFEAPGFYVFIDYPQSWQRETPGGHRFTIFDVDDQNFLKDVHLETDVWAEVLALFN